MKLLCALLLASITPLAVAESANSTASDHDHGTSVSNEKLAQQRYNLAKNTEGKGFGPQSPRNIDEKSGDNRIYFGHAPKSKYMNLCNIHFHKNAEHAGGQFTKYAGNGDGHGYMSGYKYSGKFKKNELTRVNKEICPSDHGSLQPGDTIEVHYVYSTEKVEPGSTLNACLGDSIQNPQLRVEAAVFALVNDEKALDFQDLTKVGQVKGYFQAVNIPKRMGRPVQYSGSTTGPGYNESGSPFQVTWSVRPKVAKVNISTVGKWCEGNEFEEDHAHGVRNLITNPALLSEID